MSDVSVRPPREGRKRQYEPYAYGCLVQGDHMNKSEIIDNIAASADIPKAVAGKALDAFVDSVTGALRQGDDVVLVGFGTFSVKERAERTGRNPSTGAAIKIPAAKVPSFKAGKGLKDAVN
ncbi:HU family DNA-binding protein [Nocardiopsis alba]|uniref:HU family DNA-binding protein n=1 Tax=Nocardiopsis alba TaxID=53437 RepID=UPI0034E1D02F